MPHHWDGVQFPCATQHSTFLFFFNSRKGIFTHKSRQERFQTRHHRCQTPCCTTPDLCRTVALQDRSLTPMPTCLSQLGHRNLSVEEKVNVMTETMPRRSLVYSSQASRKALLCGAACHVGRINKYILHYTKKKIVDDGRFQPISNYIRVPDALCEMFAKHAKARREQLNMKSHWMKWLLWSYSSGTTRIRERGIFKPKNSTFWIVFSD